MTDRGVPLEVLTPPPFLREPLTSPALPTGRRLVPRQLSSAVTVIALVNQAHSPDHPMEARRPSEARGLVGVSEARSPRALVAPAKPRLLERVRHAIRDRHYSSRTEEAYVGWIKRFIFFSGLRHPLDLGAEHLSAFLSALAVREQVAASTQNQALAALLFLYREVLDRDFPWLDDLVRAKRPSRVPVVLTRSEVRSVLSRIHGVPWLMATLLYGSGMRLLECCQLRVKDLDFGHSHVLVRRGKGDKDRVTVLPAAVKPGLTAHLERAREQHRRDLEAGAGWVELPAALGRKLTSAGREWVWQ